MGNFHIAPVLNLLEMRCQLPLEVIPGCILRLPTDDEVELVRRALKTFGGPVDFTLFFERKINIPSNSAATSANSFYYLLEETMQFRPGCIGESFREIEHASRLLEPELNCSLVIYPGGGMHFGGPAGLDHFESIHPWNPAVPVGGDYFALLREIHQKLQAIISSHPRLHSAIALHRQVAMVPRGKLYSLGLFSVIECVLNNGKKVQELTIVHQLQQKMDLLQRRFRKSLDYTGFGVPATEIWSILYHWRSDIAHGRASDFDAGKLKPLNGLNTAANFLESAVKTLLLHCLDEPDLISDLREC